MTIIKFMSEEIFISNQDFQIVKSSVDRYTKMFGDIYNFKEKVKLGEDYSDVVLFKSNRPKEYLAEIDL